MKKWRISFALSFVLLLGILSACTTDVPTSVYFGPQNNHLSWQDSYAKFLRENMQTNNVDESGAFLAGGYPVIPFFYLFDVDKNGIPELIYIDPNEFAGDVYSYKKSSISKLGSIDFYPFGSLGIPLDKAEGLYSDVGYKGHYGEIYLYTINNGVLTGQIVLEYNNRLETDLSYSFDNFGLLDYYEITEANITKVIYDYNSPS